MRLRLGYLCLAAVLGVAACGDEGPVDLTGLLPDGAVRTVELVLDAPEFLVWDSVRTGFTAPYGSGYLLVAEDFGGALDAHSLVRFQAPPTRVNYVDQGGTAHVDTMPSLIGGDVVIRLDTAANRLSGPVRLALYRVTEDWDPRSADWAFRVDSGSVREPWAQPGGAGGAPVDSVTISPGDTLLTFAVDSQTIAIWADTSDASRGGMIIAETPDSRVELGAVLLRVRARPSARPDTVVTDTVNLAAATFIYDPDPGSAPDDALFIGGAPTSRSYIRFEDRLDTLTFACPGGPPGCRLRIADATVNFAALQFRPVEPPAGFTPSDTVFIEARPVLVTPSTPLIRSPVGDAIAARTAVAPSTFVGPEPDDKVEIPITNLSTLLFKEPTEGAERPIPVLALLGFPQRLAGLPEGAPFGFASFGSIASGAAAPKLRLIVSVTNEVQIR